jgi:hypothetical protein
MRGRLHSTVLLVLFLQRHDSQLLSTVDPFLIDGFQCARCIALLHNRLHMHLHLACHSLLTRTPSCILSLHLSTSHSIFIQIQHVTC